MTDTVKIKIGGYYVDRLGRSRGPMIPKGNGYITMEGERQNEDDDFDWYPDGRFSLCGESNLDLIEEQTVVVPVPIPSVISEEDNLNPIKRTPYIKSGAYGRLIVETSDFDTVWLNLEDDNCDPFTAEEIRSTIKTLTILAEFLENNLKSFQILLDDLSKNG